MVPENEDDEGPPPPGNGKEVHTGKFPELPPPPLSDIRQTALTLVDPAASPSGEFRMLPSTLHLEEGTPVYYRMLREQQRKTDSSNALTANNSMSSGLGSDPPSLTGALGSPNTVCGESCYSPHQRYEVGKGDGVQARLVIVDADVPLQGQSTAPVDPPLPPGLQNLEVIVKIEPKSDTSK